MEYKRKKLKVASNSSATEQKDGGSSSGVILESKVVDGNIIESTHSSQVNSQSFVFINLNFNSRDRRLMYYQYLRVCRILRRSFQNFSQSINVLDLSITLLFIILPHIFSAGSTDEEFSIHDSITDKPWPFIEFTSEDHDGDSCHSLHDQNLVDIPVNTDALSVRYQRNLRPVVTSEFEEPFSNEPTHKPEFRDAAVQTDNYTSDAVSQTSKVVNLVPSSIELDSKRREAPLVQGDDCTPSAPTYHDPVSATQGQLEQTPFANPQIQRDVLSSEIRPLPYPVSSKYPKIPQSSTVAYDNPLYGKELKCLEPCTRRSELKSHEIPDLPSSPFSSEASQRRVIDSLTFEDGVKKVREDTERLTSELSQKPEVPPRRKLSWYDRVFRGNGRDDSETSSSKSSSVSSTSTDTSDGKVSELPRWPTKSSGKQ